MCQISIWALWNSCQNTKIGAKLVFGFYKIVPN